MTDRSASSNIGAAKVQQQQQQVQLQAKANQRKQPTTTSALSSSSSSSSSTATAASNRKQTNKFEEGEKVLCYHGNLIYEAKCLKIDKSKPNEYAYFVHYNGWNKNWDEWVGMKRILKYSDANLRKQRELIEASRLASNSRREAANSTPTTSSNGSVVTSTTNGAKKDLLAIQTVGDSGASKAKKAKLASTNNTGATNPATSATNASKSITSNQISSQDESSSNKRLCVINMNPKLARFVQHSDQIVLVMPECLKEWLVDDFDLVMQQNKLTRLPCQKPVSLILNEYRESRSNNSSQMPDLQTMVSGFLTYFDAMLGSQLLYKLERIQYTEMLKHNKPVSEIYGGIHLLRLLERLDQLVSYAPIDEEALAKLIFYTNDLTKYLSETHTNLLSASDYILAPPYYVRSSI